MPARKKRIENRLRLLKDHGSSSGRKVFGPHIDYPEVPLSDLLRKTAQAYPHHTATVYFHKEMTYKELDEASERVAVALDGLGVKEGLIRSLFFFRTYRNS